MITSSVASRGLVGKEGAGEGVKRSANNNRVQGVRVNVGDIRYYSIQGKKLLSQKGQRERERERGKRKEERGKKKEERREGGREGERE